MTARALVFLKIMLASVDNIPNYMLKIDRMLIISFIFCLFASCTKGGSPTPPATPPNPCIYNGVDTCALAAKTINATINLAQTYQTIHSFGASDCWGIKYVGKNWPDA